MGRYIIMDNVRNYLVALIILLHRELKKKV